MLSIETRADLLKALLVEDRNEIRGIRAAIYSLTTVLVTAGFAITAFLYGKDAIRNASALAWTTDALTVVMLWIVFLRLKRDLYACRQCLVARQNLVLQLPAANASDPFNPFPDARRETPDVRDTELWGLPILATGLMAANAVAIAWLFTGPG